MIQGGSKRKSLEEDKPCEEGASRLAGTDLEALAQARTQDCIQMSKIIISLLPFSEDPVSNAWTICWEQRLSNSTDERGGGVQAC